MLDGCSLQTNLDRTKFPPWGVQGGSPAQPGRFLLQREGESARDISKEKGLTLKAGDRICCETGGGGGYGAPRERALTLIQRDLEQGYVTANAAQRDYGVQVGANGKVTR
jgi:N-methylhydantoinase B/oxoprolinase/acetone carboxylase alpha subunit